MSAIAGIFNLDGEPVAPGVLELLTGAMQTHGPDGTHHHRADAIALGHCLLRTTPEAARARQPLASRDGDLLVVFDGRLDNHAELDARLGQVTGGAAPRTDAELVLAAYAEWGMGCPLQLEGEYVFAVWDARERRLFLAKDPLGARQLYFCLSKNRFAFASFDEALLLLPGMNRAPCPELVLGFLVPEFDDWEDDQTWLDAVRALKPAHTLCVSCVGVSAQRRYFDFELKEERLFASDAACGEALREVFSQAVAKRVRDIAEPGALLSGGIDSASILATLESVRQGARLHTFSGLLEPTETSAESRAIASMTARAGIEAHLLRLPSFAGPVGLEDLMNMVWARAHPVENALCLPALLCLAAQRAGHRSLLHGASGDLVLTALSNYAAPLLRTGQWSAAWHECRAASEHHTYLMGTSPLSLLLRNAWSAFVPNRLRRAIWGARVRGAAPPGLRLLNPDFARRMRPRERIRARRARAVERSRAPSRVQHAESIFEFPGVSSGLAGFQRVGSRYGVELRDPWADVKVVEHVLHLPLRHLVHRGWNKWPARAFLMENLAPEVRWRTDKEHFGWLLTERIMAESSAVIDDAWAAPGRAADFVDFAAVRAALREPGRLPETLSLDWRYDMVTLIQWLRRISGETAGQAAGETAHETAGEAAVKTARKAGSIYG